jgi:hypothetical protein
MFFTDQNTLGTRITRGWNAKMQRFDIYSTIVFLANGRMPPPGSPMVWHEVRLG